MSKGIAMSRAHLEGLIKEPMNKDIAAFFNDEMMNTLESSVCRSFEYKGKIMVCGGITNYWPGRGQVWTVFSESSKTNFVSTFRAVRDWLKEQLEINYFRIEVSIPCGFKIGQRRAEMLGFELEILRAKRYLPSGEDCSIYSMVRQ